MSQDSLTELRENTPHLWAFEFYRALGPNRSHRRVAKEMGVPVFVIRQWARHFRWQDRIAGESCRKPRELRLLHYAVCEVAKAVRDGRLKPRKPDQQRLVSLEQHLIAGIRRQSS